MLHNCDANVVCIKRFRSMSKSINDCLLRSVLLLMTCLTFVTWIVFSQKTFPSNLESKFDNILNILKSFSS